MVPMARARTTSRMEKNLYTTETTLMASSRLEIAWQLDGGEVEAQIKRIMISASATPGITFKFGLFQFAPVTADFDSDEAIVISGAVGNQVWHNETITMRVPKDYYLGIQFMNWHTASNKVVWNVQCNYKVLN